MANRSTSPAPIRRSRAAAPSTSNPARSQRGAEETSRLLQSLAARGRSRRWPMPRRRSMPPELTRGDARAFRHRRHFRPHDIRIDRGLSHPRAITAVAAGHHIFAADKLRIATDPLRDQLRMLDEIRLRLDDARNEHLAFGQLDLLEQ